MVKRFLESPVAEPPAHTPNVFPSAKLHQLTQKPRSLKHDLLGRFPPNVFLRKSSELGLHNESLLQAQFPNHADYVGPLVERVRNRRKPREVLIVRTVRSKKILRHQISDAVLQTLARVYAVDVVER